MIAGSIYLGVHSSPKGGMMKRLVLLLFALVLIVPNATAKKPGVRAELLTAKFVYVTNFPGTVDREIVDTRIYPEDRRAIVDTENAIRKWGRWTVLQTPYQADLIITVRKGRIAGAGINVPTISIGNRGPESAQRGPGVQAEAGPAEDMIAVYAAGVDQKSNVNGAIDYDAPVLWRVIQTNALASPDVPGLQQLRKEIEKAEVENVKKK